MLRKLLRVVLLHICVLLLLNHGQRFNVWNPPDVDFPRLLFPLQSESENVSKRQSLSPFLTQPSPAETQSITTAVCPSAAANTPRQPNAARHWFSPLATSYFVSGFLTNIQKDSAVLSRIFHDACSAIYMRSDLYGKWFALLLGNVRL